jgi:hypothetical protein
MKTSSATSVAVHDHHQEPPLLGTDALAQLLAYGVPPELPREERRSFAPRATPSFADSLRGSLPPAVRLSLVPLMMATATGCAAEAQEAESVGGEAISAQVSTQALSEAALSWVNGTYGANCTARSGNFSVRVNGSGAMDNAALSVVKNNTACTLSLTGLVAAGETYTASPTLGLTGSYGSASAFVKSGSSLTSFYLNAKLSSTSFSSSFTIALVVSADPNAATGGVSAAYDTVSSTSSVTSVDASDYSADTTGIEIKADADKAITSVTGSLALSDGARTAVSYVIDAATLPASPSFADYDTLFSSGSPTTISGANPSIAGSALISVGASVASPAVRTLVLRRVTSGVPAYQAFRITFSGP